MRTLKATWSLVLACAVLTAACGDSKSSLNPTAPSAVSASALNDEASGAVEESGSTARGGNNNRGGGNGNDKDKDKDKNDKDKDREQPNVPGNGGPPSNTSPSAPGKSKVEIEGLVQSVGAGSLTVNGQTVLVSADTVIRHGNRRFELSDINTGDRVHVKANRVSGGSNVAASLEATEIKLQNPGDDDDDDDDDDDNEGPSALVSVAAFDASASEAGANTGTFRLTRAGDLTLLASPLTVTFTLTGTATNGTDYTAVPLTATFAASQPTVDVVVTPTADALAEGSETVILTLTGVTPYELGSPVSATVNISDTVNPLVSVAAFDAAASESGDTGMFQLTRTGDTSASLAVTVTFTGTATNGTDYSLLSTTVTFAAGSATANVFVVPVADATVDASETVILTVVDGAAYDLGVTPSATVTITGS